MTNNRVRTTSHAPEPNQPPLPRRARLGKRAVGWFESEIDLFVAQMLAIRDGKPMPRSLNRRDTHDRLIREPERRARTGISRVEWWRREREQAQREARQQGQTGGEHHAPLSRSELAQLALTSMLARRVATPRARSVEE